ncbi:MAG TPA: hypothetical protein VKZ79_07820 [Alphaproteobacteria bacterium]|nr:hypothetical protein [Alphaproteobacteria bacterium]
MGDGGIWLTMLHPPRPRHSPYQIWLLTIVLVLPSSQTLGAGAAYPREGREPIEVLADQFRDRILQRLDESCGGGPCSNLTPGWADDIRQGCLRDTVAKHPHGIGGENDLVACMERKSRFSLSDSPLSESDDAPASDGFDDYPPAADGLDAPRAIIMCRYGGGSFEMRERGDCLDSGGAVVERAQ